MYSKKGAQILVEALVDEGIDTVFTLPGFFIMDILFFLKKSNINVVTCKNEISAAFAADGYARSSNKIGCVLVNSGPSCLNTIMAIKTSQKDGIPVVLIIGTDIRSRLSNESYFQVVNFPDNITKNIHLLTKNNLYKKTRESFCLVKSNPISPFVLEIPLDVSKSNNKSDQSKKRNINFCKNFNREYYNQNFINSNFFKIIVDSINRSQKPLVIIGAGVLQSNSEELVNKFIERFNLPAVTTFCSRGVINENNRLFVGSPGILGSESSNMSLLESDLLLVIGSRLSPRFLSEIDISTKTVFQIDLENTHIRKDLNVIPVEVDLKIVINGLMNSSKLEYKRTWISNSLNYHLKDISKKWSLTGVMNFLLPKLNDSIIFCDDGTYTIRLWQMAKVEVPRTLLFSGNMAAGGHSIPGAIGAQYANPNKKVSVITGDGGALPVISELQVYKEKNLNILIIIFNNNSYESINQWSNLYKIGFNNEIKDVNFSIIAKGFGINSHRIKNFSELKEKITRYSWDEPLLLEIMIPKEKVKCHFPKYLPN